MSSKQNIRLGIIFAFVSIISASLKTALGHNLFEFITPSVFAFLEAFISFMVLVFIYGAMPEFHKLQKLSKFFKNLKNFYKISKIFQKFQKFQIF